VLDEWKAISVLVAKQISAFSRVIPERIFFACCEMARVMNMSEALDASIKLIDMAEVEKQRILGVRPSH
jgi:hypothetical protein